jgi:superfamily II DNA or RNA helicase
MALATSEVTIEQTRTVARCTDIQGQIPWDEVNEACSFFDSAISKKLYPNKAVGAKQERPPVRLFDRETLSFPLGLLQRVVTTLEEQGIKVTIKDCKNEPTQGFHFSWKGPEPRDYQNKAVDEALAAGRYGIITLPTGGGKTLVGARLIHHLNVRTLWVVHSADLVRQTASFLEKYLGIKVGMVGAGRRNWKTVTVATAQSLKKCIGEMEAREWKPDLLIEDEVHHAGAWESFQNIQRIDAFYRYGLTATPFRTGADNLVLEAAYGSTIAHVSLTELQERGYLAKITVRAKQVTKEHMLPKSISDWQTLYTEGVVESLPRNKLVAEATAELLGEGRQVLIDVDELDHITFLDEGALDDADIMPTDKTIVIVTGSTPPKERAEIYEKFRAGETDVLIGTVLREGIDLPNASGVVLAGGGKSKVKLLQEIGRGLRATDQFEDCVVYDFVDEHHYVLFEHCQRRFRAMLQAGFEVPEGTLRQVQVDPEEDDDADIQAIRERQAVLKAKNQPEFSEEETI